MAFPVGSARRVARNNVSECPAASLDAPEFIIEIVDYKAAVITFLGAPYCQEATNIEWKMEYKCLISFLLPESQTGTIDKLGDGESAEIAYTPKGAMMLGFGPVKLVVTVSEEFVGTYSESKRVGFLLGLLFFKSDPTSL
jgi:hypothetical protein